MQTITRERLALEEAVRKVETFRIQNAARNSTEWFENVDRYTGMQVEQFAYSLLTRSQRISHENLRLRDKTWLEDYERWFAQQASLTGARPPMFTPYRLRSITLKNRVVVSPMCTYSAHDGVPNDFHFQHYTARALGGAGLVMVEMTAPCADGRITHGCPGMWSDEQAADWRRITDWVHTKTNSKIVCTGL